MGLIKCPECQSEVSDKASVCPKCGNPVLQSKKRLSSISVISFFIGVFLLIIGIPQIQERGFARLDTGSILMAIFAVILILSSIFNKNR